MNNLEAEAFMVAMDHYGFDWEELTPERERIVRRRLAYQHHLLRLQIRHMTQVTPSSVNAR